MTEEERNKLIQHLDATVLDAAQRYAKAGLRVFPTSVFWANDDKAGKRPINPKGFNGATTVARTVKQWWTIEYPRSNVAIATGAESGLLAIDIDTHGGVDGPGNLQRLEAEFGQLPATRTVRSGSGGQHLWFKYPVGHEITSTAGVAAPGIDIRAQGAGCVAPPSVHACGGIYRFENDLPLAELPDLWVSFLEGLKGIKRDDDAAGKFFSLPDMIPEGRRADTLFRFACSLQARGFNDDVIRATVEKANQERCTPPIGARELTSTVNSVLRRYAKGRTYQVQGYIPQGDLALPAYFSDADNADAFVKTYGRTLLFIAGKTDRGGYWLSWTGTHYSTPAWATVLNFAKDYALRLLEYAKAEQKRYPPESAEGKQAEQLAAHALRLRNQNKLLAMMSLASSDVAVTENSFDGDPWLLNTPSYTVNLRDGSTYPHRMADRCRLITAADPEGQKDSTAWRDFVDLVTQGDCEFANFLQCACGLSLIGNCNTEGIFIAYDEKGRNGKSTFFNAIQGVLGTGYSGSILAETLTTADQKDKQRENVALFGKRFVVAPELRENAILDTASLKNKGSTDKVVARYLYGEEFDFFPTHTTFLFCNNRPKVNSNDGGTWRRLHPLPFGAQMPTGKDEIPNYAAVLVEKSGGEILRWLLDGARQYVANGCHLPTCAAVEAARAEWRGMATPMAHFAMCMLNVTGNYADRIRRGDLYAAYRQWCGDSVQVVRQNIFNDGIKALDGVHEVEENRVRWFTGIRFRVQGTPANE